MVLLIIVTSVNNKMLKQKRFKTKIEPTHEMYLNREAIEPAGQD